MSQVVLPPDAVEIPAPPPGGGEIPATRKGSGWGLWLRVALAVALLAASGVARAWQAGRVDQMLRDGRKAPFALKDLPMALGPWVGHDDVVDEIIIRTTGSTDSIFRSYQHQGTGQKVSLLVLFGPSVEMYGHSPEVCYPSTGFAQVGSTRVEDVKAGDDSWPFRELVYRKGTGGKSETQQVYYTWKYSGKWTPNPTDHKEFERIPSMFKVQVARAIRDGEIEVRDVANPCESILALLMPEIDRRVAEAAKQPEAPAPTR